MTQEEKRIKLAEFAGIQIHFPYDPAHASDEQWLYRPDNAPDYFNDLNAVQQLRDVLEARGDDYWKELWMVVRPVETLWVDTSSLKYLIHATAAQRAEALGRALGLWGGPEEDAAA